MHKTTLQVIKALVEADRPLTLSELARRIKRSKQATQYHISILAESMLLFREHNGETPAYHLQPPFYDNKAIDALYHLLIPYAEATAKQTIGNNQTVIEVLKGLLQLFLLDLEARQKDFDTALNEMPA